MPRTCKLISITSSRAADPGARALDDLAVGTDGREMQAFAVGGGDFAEKRVFHAGLAIQFDERVADRVLPELEAFARGNIGGRQYGFHVTAPASSMTPKSRNRFSQKIMPRSHI
jgi:hypothetical protein